MNRFVRGLLSGASFAALNFGMFAGTARAAGISVNTNAHGPVTVPAHGTASFIWVRDGGEVHGSITNHGVIGPPPSPGPGVPNAIEVSGIVDGIISNAHDGSIVVSDNQWGIQVRTSANDPAGAGEIFNAGHISVHHTGNTGGGIDVSAHAIVPTIQNNGTIKVTGVGTVSGTGTEFGFRLHQQHSTAAVVKAKYLATGGKLTVSNSAHLHLAPGVKIFHVDYSQVAIQEGAANVGTGGASAVISNIGGAIKILNKVVATGTTVTAAANLGRTNTPVIGQSAAGHPALAQLNNSGTLLIKTAVDVTATIDAEADALAGIIKQDAYGYGGAATAGMANFSDITVSASAQARGPHEAIVRATVGKAKHSGAGFTVVNDAISQHVQSGTQGLARIDNHASLKIAARAFGSASAGTALAFANLQGIRQRASGTGDAHALLSNHAGADISLLASAHASGRAAIVVAQIGSVSRGLTPTNGSHPRTSRLHAISQIAVGGGHVSADIENSGSLTIKALARADVIGILAHGDAILEGIRQDADLPFAVSESAIFRNKAGGVLLESAHAFIGGNTRHDGNSKVALLSDGLIQTVTGGFALHAYISNLGAGGSAANMTMNAGFIAHSAGATGSARARLHAGVRQKADDFGTAALDIENTGSIKLNITASATGNKATALARQGLDGFGGFTSHGALVYQSASSGNTAAETLHNKGSLAIKLQAKALAAGNTALASVNGGHSFSQHTSSPAFRGVAQTARDLDGAGAFLNFTNEGSLGIKASAIAHAAHNNLAAATAKVGIATAIGQYAVSAVNTAHLHLSNKAGAQLSLTANASAQGGHVSAGITMHYGIAQIAQVTAGHAADSFVNAGDLNIGLSAKATGTNGVAHAIMRAGVIQAVSGAQSSATAKFTNIGDVSIHASAKISAAGSGFAVANGNGIQQDAALFGGNNDHAAALLLDNSGDMRLILQASDKGQGGGAVFAGAYAGGFGGAFGGGLGGGALVLQSALAGGSGIALLGVQNEAGGKLFDSAKAVASGANATAVAENIFAVKQFVTLTGPAQVVMVIANKGDITAKAAATLLGNGRAYASAVGLWQGTSSGGSATVHVAAHNSGQIQARATAKAVRTASALAAGAAMFVPSDNAVVDFLNATGAKITAIASGQGASGLVRALGLSVTGGKDIFGAVENDGTLKVTAIGPQTRAAGIMVKAAGFGGAITNKGSISVEADGAHAQAVAIQVTNYSFTKSPPPLGSISNVGGTISAKLVNGGVTTWGTAIDVSNAPNAMAIGLSGNGNIYGNLKLKSNSAVTVSGPGVTFFSGVINPSKTKAGTLTIAAGGNLELANDAAQGNAKAYVTSFSQPGTLSVDIGAATNATPYINAGAVTLSGALVVVPGAALPVNGTTYKIIGSDAALSTTWSGVSIKGAPALLSVAATYLPNEADVTITVTPPAALGLTANQLAALTPFEKQLANILTLSSIAPDSALGKLVTALFTLTAPQLADVLDQLGNLDAGAQAQANLSFATALLNQILDHLGIGGSADEQASLSSVPGVRPAQMTSGAGTVWGGIYGARASTRSVAGSPGNGTTLSGLIAGYDVALNTDMLLGLAVAYSTDTTKTGSPGGHGSANGFQLSPYFQLARDSGFFARGALSYGNYNNKLSRTVTIPGFGTGTLSGKFNSDVYSAYLEAGQKFVTDDGTAVSPYAALGYARSASGAYTETGFAGPALHVQNAVAQTLTSYLGVGFEKRFALGEGSILPHIRIAWAHDYSGSAWQVAAQFAALPGTGFVINGPSLSRDKAYINAGVSLHLSDGIETSLNYDALFNNDQSQQSLMGVLRFSF